MTRRGFWRRLVALFFPARCAYCGEVIPPHDRVCAACAAKLPVVDNPACPDCGHRAEDCSCGG